MIIKTIKVGSLQTNCYIIIDKKSSEAIVIDPGDEADKIIPELEGLKVKYIVLTHGHPDHFGAIDDIKEKTGAPILAHPADNWFFPPDEKLEEGDEIIVGNIILKVFYTPGHTEGGICLYTQGHLFAGDTLFKQWHGRVDLPGGSMSKMKKSLERLATLPDDTKVYPGHDEFTTIGQEKIGGALA